MEKRKLNKTLLTTMTGVAGGAILGLLFAPDKGSATRKKIGKQSDKYFKKAQKDVKEVRKYLNKRAEETKEDIDKLGRNAKTKGNDLLTKAKKIASNKSYEEWTKEELYQHAKEANIDGYSQMNKDELITALKKN